MKLPKRAFILQFNSAYNTHITRVQISSKIVKEFWFKFQLAERNVT